MALWGDTVATLSFMLAVAAFVWAVRTFGKSRQLLSVEVSIVGAPSLQEDLGSLEGVLRQVIEVVWPGTLDIVTALHQKAAPVLPQLVTESPLLGRVLPSLANLFVETPRFWIEIRNVGVSDVAVAAVEIGDGKLWHEIEGRSVFGRWTDVLPVSVRAGSDVAVWYPLANVEETLSSLGITIDDAVLRVRTTAKKFFTAKGGDFKNLVLDGAAS